MIILLTNQIRVFAIFTVYLEDIVLVEQTVSPRKTLQDLCQDATFNNSYRGNLGHLCQKRTKVFLRA